MWKAPPRLPDPKPSTNGAYHVDVRVSHAAMPLAVCPATAVKVPPSHTVVPLATMA